MKQNQWHVLNLDYPDGLPAHLQQIYLTAKHSSNEEFCSVWVDYFMPATEQFQKLYFEIQRRGGVILWQPAFVTPLPPAGGAVLYLTRCGRSSPYQHCPCIWQEAGYCLNEDAKFQCEDRRLVPEFKEMSRGSNLI